MTEQQRVQEIGDRFDRLFKPLAELGMRLQALNREFPNNPLYTQALSEVKPDKMNEYASLFWDRGDALARGRLKEGLAQTLSE